MDAPLTPLRRDEMIEVFAAHIRASRMQMPAMLLLEMHAPLAFLGSQFLLATQPFIGFLTGDPTWRELAAFLEDPVNVTRLISKLEQDTQLTPPQRAG